MIRAVRRCALAATLLCCASAASAYPLDGYEYTGIRRLDQARRVQTGELTGRVLPAGARLPMAEVLPRFPDRDPSAMPAADAALSAQLTVALGADAERYSVAVLDLSDPDAPRYAVHNEAFRDNVGSVGKLLVAVAVFTRLAELYPDDLAARERILRTTEIEADRFIDTDHHEVPIWYPEQQRFEYRALRHGDRGTLWEYMDWMLSASSNAAASMVMRELLLLEEFGSEYPVSAQRREEFLQSKPGFLGERLAAIMTRAAQRNGIDTERYRQGSFFTAEGQRRVAGPSSYGNTAELVKLLYRLETAQIVDAFSSRELKRLLYMTQRRIRYASHPVLDPAAVYFKSGSLYKCEPEPGFVCKKYMGNKLNLLASVAIVEAPAGERRLHYLVAVLSNVLRVNSAVAHQTLALRIHRLIEAQHPVAPPPTPTPTPVPEGAGATP
jgi:hypothetical protein